jgi:hypothetical protein
VSRKPTDIRAIVRQAILDKVAAGGTVAEIAREVAPAWECAPRSAEATLWEDFTHGEASLSMDALGPLLRALGLRIAPGEDTTDVRAIVRARALDLGNGAYRWADVAEKVAPAWGRVRQDSTAQMLSQTFGDKPRRSIRIHRLGPVLDALGLRIVKA